MTARHIAVVGSGWLARSICRSFATLAGSRRGPAAPALRLTVLARDEAAAREIARTCRVRAAVSGAAVEVGAQRLHDEADALARLRPDLLVCCASAQSPYERATAPSAWTDLVARAGFGITLPLQASVAARLARAVAGVSPGTLLINGCFPDAVNPLLAALGLPVHCGIGNVATVAALLQATLRLPDQRELAVLGHHVHLAAPRDPADEVLAWHAGTPVNAVGDLLAADRALPRRELNAIAGHAAARLLVDLADTLDGATEDGTDRAGAAEIYTSLPAPLGLPGGYPVRLSGRAIALNLPTWLARADAVAWNERVGRPDGVTVRDGLVSYPEPAAAALAEHLPDLAAGWPATALDEVTDRLTALRQRLRPAQPVPVAPAR